VHEALLRQWRPLREAMRRPGPGCGLRSELEQLEAEWKQGRYNEAYLVGGGWLAAFEQWAGEHAGELSLLERQVLQPVGRWPPRSWRRPGDPTAGCGRWPAASRSC
jgi:hypothetical protein